MESGMYPCPWLGLSMILCMLVCIGGTRPVILEFMGRFESRFGIGLATACYHKLHWLPDVTMEKGGMSYFVGGSYKYMVGGALPHFIPPHCIHSMLTP